MKNEGEIKKSSLRDLDPSVWKIVAVVLLGPLMAQMDSTVVNVSLSAIGTALQASLESTQWIISGYLLALALTLPLNGWLVDRLGAKRLYLICFTTFTLASLLCGAARTITELIAARVIQGMAGGLLAPMAQLMIARVAGRHMARLIGYAAIPVLVAPVVGPVVAGAILRYQSWPWLFFINLPIGILALGLAVLLLPRDEPSLQARPFDFFGFLLISPGLVCLLYGFEHSSHPYGLIVLFIGTLLLGAFVWDALRKQSAALLDIRLFKNVIFRTAIITQFLSNGVIYAGQMLVPLFLMNGCRLPAAQAGWVLAPMGLGMMCVYPFMGTLTDKLGCRAVSVTGVLLNTVGTLPFLWMVENHYSPVLMALCMFARGAGQGSVGVPSLSAGYAAVPREKLALATTAANIVQRLGGPIATTALTIVIALSASSPAPAIGQREFFVPFLALIFLQLTVLGSASRLPLRIHQNPAGDA